MSFDPVNASLFVVTPCWDKTVSVPESFLQKNGLKKAMMTPMKNSKISELWKEAKQVSEKKYKGRCGGSGTHVMQVFANMGFRRCSVIGRIGSDTHGKKIEKQLCIDLKVNSLLIKDEKLSTATVTCFMTHDERTMLADFEVSPQFKPEDIKKDQLQNFKHWHIEGYMFYFEGVVAKCLEIAIDNHALLSLNLPTTNVIKDFLPSFKEHISKFHYIFGNVEEIKVLTGKEDIQEALETFADEQMVVATDGGNNCWVKNKGEKHAKDYAVLKVEKVSNKTGAGDRWAGFFLAAALQLQGGSVELCVELAKRGAADWIQLEPDEDISKKTWEVYQECIRKML